MGFDANVPDAPDPFDLGLNPEFAAPASAERLARARDALLQHHISAEIVEDGAAAKAAVLALVPDGAVVHVGLSQTMKDLGVTAEIEESGRYDAVRPRLLKLNREKKRREIARLVSIPDFMLGSVQAVTEDGQLVAGSGTGSQLAAYATGAGKVIIVAGAQKVVHDLDEGLRRLREYCLPMEDARMKSIGRGGSVLSQTWVLSYDFAGRFHVFLVADPIGF